MKKLMLFILGIVFIGANSLAQVTARTADSHVLPIRRSFYEYTGVAGDTIGVEKDTLTFEVLTNKNVPLVCNARIEFTRTGSSEDYEIRLQGKVFENDSWTAIIDSLAQTASLSLYHPDVEVEATQAGSVDVFYRYFRILIANDGTCAAGDRATIDAVIWKFYER